VAIERYDESATTRARRRERDDESSTMTVTDADPDAARAELLRYVAADAA
jgi:hypothetical protein